MVQARTFEQLVGIARQADAVTAEDPTIGFPLTGLNGAPQITATIDQGRRGVGSRDFEAIPDAGHSEFTMEGFAYPDTIGHLLLAMMGSLSTAAGPPLVHTFTRGTNPPAYTIEDTIKAGASGALRYVGSRIGQLAFSYESSQGVLGYTSSWMSRIGAQVTPQAVTVDPADSPFQGWRGVVTSAGLSALVTAADITISRELQVVHNGENTQQPLYINVGPIAAEGTITAITEDVSLIDKYIDGVEQSFQLEFDQGQAADAQRKIQFLMSQCFLAAQPMEIDRGGVSVFLRMGFLGIHNATDGGPIQVELTNGVANSVYAGA